jgi:hypothetical protein
MKEEVKQAIKVLEQATANCATGDRHIVVLDRGWIFAGNLSKDEHHVYTLTDAVNVRKWDSGGFGALSKSATAAGATLDKCATLRFHETAMMFAVPISSDWHE